MSFKEKYYSDPIKSEGSLLEGYKALEVSVLSDGSAQLLSPSCPFSWSSGLQIARVFPEEASTSEIAESLKEHSWGFYATFDPRRISPYWKEISKNIRVILRLVGALRYRL